VECFPTPLQGFRFEGALPRVALRSTLGYDPAPLRGLTALGSKAVRERNCPSPALPARKPVSFFNGLAMSASYSDWDLFRDGVPGRSNSIQ